MVRRQGYAAAQPRHSELVETRFASLAGASNPRPISSVDEALRYLERMWSIGRSVNRTGDVSAGEPGPPATPLAERSRAVP
jgi:hypothetical protein